MEINQKKLHYNQYTSGKFLILKFKFQVKTSNPPTSDASLLPDCRGRTQRVKINSVHSNFLQVPAGIPQGTKIGPWLFLAIINDLCITKSPTSNLWKFADDTSVSEVILKDGVSSLPDKVDEVNKWSNDNKFQLNPGKCKELRINFTTQPFTEEPLNINGKPFEIVKFANVTNM